ncbi:hypothetical protein, conserved [Eimeria tenella]|uniref:Thioredoxin domain-containing protein n=1 Tax=Eimeria tenella TaxID=5802 RepID=U6KMD4_EIMTE|nr:hypothetical protein, conserved [Eimeria tenella]CDJ39272.1 hypothetical protein, conserved [Eimeria tenella]|eukprot:XP_013230027.1 hypothetical protein, conserved [Eimeria tenella]
MAEKVERVEIENETHFEELVKAADDPRLFVIDLYCSWCGPCNAVLPTLRDLLLTLDGFRERCCFAAAAAAAVPELAALGASATPKFLFFKDGTLLAQVLGANAPQLKQKIEELLPPLQPPPNAPFA